jgi:hypothetical protein
MKNIITRLILICLKGQQITRFPISILFIALFCIPSMRLVAGENLFNYSLLGSATLAKNEVTPSLGGLISVRIKGNVRVETGYHFDIFMESQKAELLQVTNTVYYHTIPLALSYSLSNFDFVLGSSFHITGLANLSVYRVYEGYKGNEEISLLDEKETTDSYRKMFCSLFCNVRYNFGGYYGIGATYGYGITDRYANSLFKSPLQYASLTFYLRLNKFLLD